jgi:hypothetical protein
MWVFDEAYINEEVLERELCGELASIAVPT